jgi:uncharacterized protein
MDIIDTIRQPWPWYVAGPLIGLTVPLLFIVGNKSFGLSSTFRHICAACLPSKIPYFNYDWKAEKWSLMFVLGIFIGGIITTVFLTNPNNIEIDSRLVDELATYQITEIKGWLPPQLFSWSSLFSLRGFILIVVGGFLIGFGTRYGDGCTSGHAIMGISSLQWSSLVATCCFMIGGILAANFILPFILSL